MRTVPQGIAFQIALRNCSREASGKVSIYVLLVNKKYTHFCRRLLLVSEKAMAPHSSTLAWLPVHGVAKSRTQLSDFPFTFHLHALEKEMATHSSVLALRIPGTGEPGGLPSMGSCRVRHN